MLANAEHTGDACLILRLGRSPGGGNGNPFQYSCLENPMDRGAWWATVHGAQKVRNDGATLNQLNFYLYILPSIKMETLKYLTVILHLSLFPPDGCTWSLSRVSDSL